MNAKIFEERRSNFTKFHGMTNPLSLSHRRSSTRDDDGSGDDRESSSRYEPLLSRPDDEESKS
jgi:hypothetical protein